jgi:hypothetical protein
MEKPTAIIEHEGHAEIVAIEGAQLSSVTFVQDYVQLNFDGPSLTAITLPAVVIGELQVVPGARGYRDALCAQIGKIVLRCDVRVGDRLQIEFNDSSVLTISLKSQDYRAEEAVVFRHNRTTEWASW